MYIRTQKKPYASLISLFKVNFYQKLGLFQRNVNVVTTKTNFHLNGFVILSRNLNKYFSHDQADLIQYFRPLLTRFTINVCNTNAIGNKIDNL